MIKIYLYIFISFLFIGLYGQGSWYPPNANLSYPRIVSNKDSIAAIQNNLLNEPQKSIYSAVYSNGMAALPIVNTSDNERRNRATRCKNAAFSYLINKKIVGNTLISIPMAERDTLLKHALTLLNTMNTLIDSITLSNLTAYDNWQWRSKEIINYATAYDCLKGALVHDSILLIAKNKLQLFTGNLYKECDRNIFGISFWSFNKNNFALIMAAALGTSAIVINDAGSNNPNYQPEAWLYCALARVDSLLWFDANHKSIKGKLSGYAESPYYFLYSLQHLNSFFIGLDHFVKDDDVFIDYSGRKKNIKQPLHDSDYDKLFDWIYLLRMPDGRVPAIEDTYMDVFNTTLALTGKRKYYTRNYYSKMSKYQANSFISTLSAADDYRVNFLGLNYTQFNSNFPETPSQILKDAGNIVFRSGWDSAANYMHITAEKGIARSEAGGHNQADEMSFIIHSNGQLLALDAGYIQYDQRSSVCQATNHNMLLVDGQATACGSPGNSGGSDVFIFNDFSTSNFEYVETKTNYSNTDITRCAMMIDKKYFALFDLAEGTNTRNFTWQLHGYGMANGNDSLGYFTDSTQSGFATWRKNGVTLQANIIAKDNTILFSKTTGIHELFYLQPETHTTLLATLNAKKEILMASVLYPYTNLADTISNSTNLISIKNGNSKTFFSLGNETETRVKGNAEATYLKLLNDSVKTLFARKCTLLERRTSAPNLLTPKDIYAVTNSECNLFLENPLSQNITVYISNANTLKLATHYLPIAVNGTNVISWKIISPTNILEIQTSGEGKIDIQCGATPIIYQGLNNKLTTIAALNIYPNPAFGLLHIETIKPLEYVKIYSISGVLIQKSPEKEIHIESLTPGFYIINVCTIDGIQYFRKFQKI